MLKLIGVWVLTLTVAQTAGNTPVDQFIPLLNYGTVGLLAFGFFTGRIISKPTYEQALKDRDRDHGELVALRQKLEDVVIPGFIRMSDLTQRLLDRERDAEQRRKL